MACGGEAATNALKVTGAGPCGDAVSGKGGVTYKTARAAGDTLGVET
jgi:hypothetical protein